MTIHLQKDLDNLKKEVLNLGAMVVEAIDQAIISLVERRVDLAKKVSNGDDVINEKEVAIEEECLKILALHQPVATDLRFIITVLKVNDELERMGDLAVNIAERASYLSAIDKLDIELDFPRMYDGTQKMVRASLESLINSDVKLAESVLAMDDEIDQINRDMYVVLQKQMKGNPDNVERAVHLLSTSRHLERIADLSTNIAEDVVFMVKGELIRHRVEDYSKDNS